MRSETLPQDVGARVTGGRSIGMRRGRSAGVTHAGARPPGRPARLCLQVLGRRVWPVRILRGSGEEKRDNWPNDVQLLRTAHLQSDVTAGARRAAIYI